MSGCDPMPSELLVAGREVYAMGKAHEGVQQGNSYKSPYRYAETTWTDDMEWGAAELFRATGEDNVSQRCYPLRRARAAPKAGSIKTRSDTTSTTRS